MENCRHREYHVPHHAYSAAAGSIRLIELRHFRRYHDHLKVEDALSRNKSLEVLKEQNRVSQPFNHPTLRRVQVDAVPAAGNHEAELFFEILSFNGIHLANALVSRLTLWRERVARATIPARPK